MKRAYISLKTKLAAAICVIFSISHDDQKAMTEDQVLSLANWDHWPVRYDDAIKQGINPNTHHNLWPRPIKAHRKKTATIDRPQMAKADRLSAAQIETRRRILARKEGEPMQRSKWAGRKLQSRGLR